MPRKSMRNKRIAPPRKRGARGVVEWWNAQAGAKLDELLDPQRELSEFPTLDAFAERVAGVTHKTLLSWIAGNKLRESNLNRLCEKLPTSRRVFLHAAKGLPDPEPPERRNASSGNAPLPVIRLGAWLDDGLTVDLGMAWGLRRTSFVVVVANVAATQLEDALVAAEDVLRSKGNRFPGDQLAERLWIALEPSRDPHGPGSVEHVLAQLASQPEAIARQEAFGEALKDGALPSGTGLGFVLRLGQPTVERVAATERWCRWLLRMWPRHTAIVVDLHVETKSRAAIEFALTLRRRLLETLEADVAVDAVATCPGGPSPPPRQDVTFQEWLRAAGVTPDHLRSTYPALADYVVPQRLEAATLDAVFADIARSSDTLHQFLALAVTCAPQSLEPLVASGAASRHEDVRRAALEAARTDRLLDLFADHASWDDLLDDEALLTASRHRTAVNDLFLALLRLIAAQPQRTAVLAPAVQKLKGRVRPWLAELAAVVTGETRLQIPRRCPPGDWRDLSRSGLDARVSLADDVLPRLDEIGPWWWLCAQPPDGGIVERLLPLPLRYRLILGLVTDEELIHAGTDEGLLEFARERRPGDTAPTPL